MLGRSLPVKPKSTVASYGCDVDDDTLMHCRFRNKNVICHAFNYSRKGFSASFYAVLYNDTFVKIDYIISKGN